MFHRFLNWLATKSLAYRQLEAERDTVTQIMATYAGALRTVVNTVDAVAAPNGTSQKIRRIANEAFASVPALRQA